MRTKTWSVAGFLLLFAAGCASTQVTSSWRNPSFAGQVPRNVLVLASIPDLPIKQQVEQAGAAKLNSMGIRATPAFSVMPASTAPTRDSVHAALEKYNFDGLFLSSYKGTTQDVSYVPPAGYVYGPYLGWGWGWGGAGYYAPGYVQSTPETQMQTTLFDVRGNGQIIWSATSSSISSGSSQSDVNTFVSTVVGRMGNELGIPVPHS
jgi:hypothetical protein